MSLRIGEPRAYAENRDLSGRTRNDGEDDTYLERLVKLVPAEVIAAYPVLKGSAAADPTLNGSSATDIAVWALPLTAWILLAVVVVLRWHATYSPGRGPQWMAVVLSAISFVIWVNVVNGSFGIHSIAHYFGVESLLAWSASDKSQLFLSSLLLVVWTLIVPVIYKGDDR